jgi:two-component system cell cycle sensor histidine kinase/response regulator CckA
MKTEDTVSRAGGAPSEGENRLQQILDNTSAVIFAKDSAGRYIFANRELQRMVRLPAEGILGRTDLEIWPPALAERFRRNDLQVIEQRRSIRFEEAAALDGRERTFLSFKFPLFGADGIPYAVGGIATDISDRKRIEDALRSAALAVSGAEGASVFQELVRFLAAILDVEIALIAIFHEDDRCRMRVRAFCLDGKISENFDYPLAGTPCETVVGKVFRIYPSRLCEQFPLDADFRSMGVESYAGFPLNDSQGRPMGLISAVSRRPLENPEFVESVLKIFAVRAAAELERERVERALRDSEASYKAIFEASEDAIFIHDWDTGAIVDVNAKACAAYGYSRDEMLRLSVSDVSSGQHPYTAEEAGRHLQQARMGKTQRFEWHRRNRDGSLHWDEVVLKRAEIAGEPRIVAFTREITGRKHAEEKRAQLEAQLRQAQKMEAIGHLTGGIAHDFNNLLTSIMGYIVLAGERQAAAGDARLAKYLEQARLSCERARDLIQQMLTFSRGQRGEPRAVSLPPLVHESLKLIKSSFPSSVEIDGSFGRETPAALLDPVQIDQVLLNLCINARDAMGGTGSIRVGVQHAAQVEGVCTACRQQVKGDFVELSVADSGPGIAPEIIDRMFEPFFSTKEVGKGSGMGLATVHGIVHEHGGHLIVETGRGEGANFRVLFPPLHSDGPASGGAAASGREVMPRAALHGNVLVVDDEEAVGEFMRDLLESWGLQATVAAGAVHARDMFVSDTARFDLVITDQTMPRMTGLELARELRALRSDLPVILYTGFSDGISPQDIRAAGVRALITKPIEPHVLFGLLQAHLPRR